MSHRMENCVLQCTATSELRSAVRPSGNNFDLDQKFVDRHVRPRVVTPRLGSFQALSLGIIYVCFQNTSICLLEDYLAG